MRGPVLDNYRVEITGLPTPTNQPPVLAAISNQTIGAGAVLSVTNSVADPDLPPQMLTFSLLTSPAGSVIDPNSGVIHWRPTIAQGGGVYPLTLTVLDDGVPRLGATQSFDVTVTPAAVPTISGVGWGGGRFEMTVGGSAGADYTVWASTNLLDWAVVLITNSPAVPFQWNDPDSISHPRRFYRVGIGP
jgi:hypothetical protein